MENTKCSKSLKILFLDKNNLADSISDALTALLHFNTRLKDLDLSYNQITGVCMSKALSVLRVSSSSANELKFLDLNISLQGNPCDYSNKRETINTNKQNYSSQMNTLHPSAVYEDASDPSNPSKPLKSDVITNPMPYLARSKNTMKFTFHMNSNTTNPIATSAFSAGEDMMSPSKTGDAVANAEGQTNVEEAHKLSIMDHVPLQAQKQFAVRKYYMDTFDKLDPDL